MMRAIEPAPAEVLPGIPEVEARYPSLCTDFYLGLIKSPQKHDPVFRQVAPDADELMEAGSEDAVGESRLEPVPGLLHRYLDRALIIASRHCFVRCRHCMRKRLWKSDGPVMSLWNKGGGCLSESALRGWLSYLRSHAEIEEVILSGGDPLTLCDKDLAALLDELRVISHLRTLRVHTRAVVVAPGRVTPRLAAMLASKRVHRLVTQFNHPVEITPESRRAVRALKSEGIRVENQAVLLRGVNDDPETLAGLFSGLCSIGVRNRYLHHPDRAKGTMHFFMPLEKGWEIFNRARKKLGQAIAPEYVVDLPGTATKTPVAMALALSQNMI